MSANTNPIYSGKPDVQWNASAITGANTAMDGSGTVVLCFQADTTNGGYVSRIRVQPLGTNVATVMRFFLNNNSTNATAANNSLIAELLLPATTASNAVPQTPFEINCNFGMKPSHKINVTIGTAVAAGFAVTVLGGNYTA